MSLELRVEDRLDGHNNYSVWKERMQSIFEEAEVWDIMVHTTQNPVVVPTDATKLADYNKKNNKVGEVIPPTELVRIAVNGLPPSWMNFTDGVCARETLPTWERFWDDCIQTEIRKGSKKGKGKKQTSTSNGGGKGKGKGKQGNAQKDYSKVKCWNCQNMGHYAVVCSKKKKKKGKNQSMEASVEVEDFADHFDREFGFTACESSSAGSPATQGKDTFDVSRGTPANSVRVIGVTHAKVLQKFAFNPFLALRSSTEQKLAVLRLCEIWHRRMGHMYHGALRTLQEITTGVPDFSTDHFDTCRGCAMGKSAKSPFPNSDNRVIGILDLIHSDVSGRMSHVSLSGYEYYVLFIDDHSRKTWIYFLKTKNEVFKRFQEFRALVERQTGQKIKSLRSDNGGKYTLGEFVDYCSEAGIRREFTVPYNP
eukprot:PITA_17406